MNKKRNNLALSPEACEDRGEEGAMRGRVHAAQKGLSSARAICMGYHLGNLVLHSDSDSPFEFHGDAHVCFLKVERRIHI